MKAMDAVKYCNKSMQPNKKRSRCEDCNEFSLPSIPEIHFPKQGSMVPKLYLSPFLDTLDHTEVQPLSVSGPNQLPKCISECRPLGLSLRKSPSLLDLIQKQLSESDTTSSVSEDQAQQNLPSLNTENANLDKDKLKAANFPATHIQIGTWQRWSRYDGDLVAKCYYAKRKLVWELLENGLKNKMEIQWSDISALKAVFPDGKPAVLEIELCRPPLFFHEITPQPRKHTLWHSTTDFTDGQASTCRRHTIQFPAGIFERHFEKLLRCDERLTVLSKQTASIPNSCFTDKEYMFLSGCHQGLNYLSDPPGHGLNYLSDLPGHAAAFLTSASSSIPHSVGFGYNHGLANLQGYCVPNFVEPLSAPINEMLKGEGVIQGALNLQQHGLQQAHPVNASNASPRSVIDVKLGMDESSSTSSEIDEFQLRDETTFCRALQDDLMSLGVSWKDDSWGFPVTDDMFEVKASPSNIQSHGNLPLDSLPLDLIEPIPPIISHGNNLSGNCIKPEVVSVNPPKDLLFTTNTSHHYNNCFSDDIKPQLVSLNPRKAMPFKTELCDNINFSERAKPQFTSPNPLKDVPFGTKLCHNLSFSDGIKSQITPLNGQKHFRFSTNNNNSFLDAIKPQIPSPSSSNPQKDLLSANTHHNTIFLDGMKPQFSSSLSLPNHCSNQCIPNAIEQTTYTSSPFVETTNDRSFLGWQWDWK